MKFNFHEAKNAYDSYLMQIKVPIKYNNTHFIPFHTCGDNTKC